ARGVVPGSPGRTAAEVGEEEVGPGVVGNARVGTAVAVHVVGGDAERLAHRDLEVGGADLDAGGLADVGEPAAVVAQQGAERAIERRRGAVRAALAGARELEVLGAVDVGGPAHVAADEHAPPPLLPPAQEDPPADPPAPRT